MTSIPDSKIAITLYNLRAFCQTEEDYAATLDKVVAMGYKCVQISGVPLPAEIIRKHLDRTGLYCCATHENLATISGDSKALIDRLQTIGCNFTALGGPGEFDFTSFEAINGLADIFKRQGDALAEAGIQLAYHNHAAELTKVAGSKKTMLETFMELTEGHNVYSELDVHWVTRGGGSPAAWIRKFAGRISVIHFKDFVMYDKAPIFCEIGEGNLDWPEILKACEETGVRWYSIEQDREFPGRGIFESAKISIDNLRSWGVK
ncbi:MAG: sugar phosphate isomerase/epimerase [Lentisphaeria bacterium]|nr:sugar phosphate isomerase/epimerase [Lentisphaeria bacterium]